MMIANNWENSDSGDSLFFKYHRYLKSHQKNTASTDDHYMKDYHVEDHHVEDHHVEDHQVEEIRSDTQWRNLVAKALDANLDKAINDKDTDMEAQIHKEISLFKSFKRICSISRI